MARLPDQSQVEPSPYAQSLLQSLEPVPPTPSTTAFFADFASTYYHPRSLLPITLPYPTVHASSNVTVQGPTQAASGPPNRLASFEAGSALFAARDNDIDILDTDLRPWIEECDGLQAVQVFTSSDDAWSGFTTKYVERMRDELGKSSIWVWGLDNSIGGNQNEASGPQTKAKQRESATNAALALRDISQNVSIYVPLALPRTLPPNVRLDRNVLWHTAGLLSAAIETVTLPVRLTDNTSMRITTLQDWEDNISGGGRRKVAGLCFGLADEDAQSREPGSDFRMRGSHNTAEDDRDDNEVTAKLDESLGMSLFPEGPFNLMASSRGKIKSVRKKTFARIDSFRGERSSSSFPPAEYERLLEKKNPIVEM